MLGMAIANIRPWRQKT